jgi:hypothetical protein
LSKQPLDPVAAALVPLVEVGGELAAPVGLVLVERARSSWFTAASRADPAASLPAAGRR